MELRLNLATCSLKDAEHAIFIIGAYFGMTDLPNIADVHRPGMVPAALTPVVAAINADGTVTTTPAPAPAPTMDPAAHGYVEQDENPAAVFAAPAQVPPGAGEAPMTADPAAVFTSGATPAPVAPPAMPGTPTPSPATVAPSAPIAAGPVGSPVPQAPAPVASASGVELDADGLPWDQRIHASGENGAKPKNADGRWRKKRGLNDASLVAAVQAELRATLAAPAVPPGTPPAVAPTPPAPPVAPPPAPPAPAVVPQAPAVPQGADPQTFEALMPRITAAVMAGTLPQTALLGACNAYGVATIPLLQTRPDLVPTIWAYLRSMYPALV